MKLVILDAGHAEKVSGKEAPDKSMREWEFNNWMQNYLKPRLVQLGFTVFLTNPQPQGANEMGLSLRSSKANNYWVQLGKPQALFVSLHANAYGVWTNANGPEVYHANNASNKSKLAAKIVDVQIYNAIKQLRSNSVNRGVKSHNYTVIQKAAMPSILIEYAFYTNREDLKILKNNRKELAEATIKALCQYFDVPYVPPQVNTSTVDLYYRVVCGFFSNRDNANQRVQELKQLGCQPFLVSHTSNGVKGFRVIASSTHNRIDAENLLPKLSKYSPFIEVYKK